MPDIATRVTHVDLGAARVISSGSVTVHGIYIVGNVSSNKVITFKDSDDTVLLKMITTNINRGASLEVKWLADNGLKIDSLSDSDIAVTIFHDYID